MELFQIIGLIVLQLVIPLYFAASIWRSKKNSKLDWLLETTALGSSLCLILFLGRWDWFSYYLRFVIAAPFVIGLIISVRRLKDLPFFEKKEGIKAWASPTSNTVCTLVFCVLLLFSFVGRTYDKVPLGLAFPLNTGIYYIAHGGNSRLLNYHNISNSQKYALDIVKLNPYGSRAAGIYPKDLSRYAIFGDTLLSPCDGVVVKAVDGLPDQTPPETDRNNIAGNHLLLRCDDRTDVIVVLAHMQRGSIAVANGDIIKRGDKIGCVGNSGNTSEPHLHIHAKHLGRDDSGLDGHGVPMLFEGRFLIRNNLVHRR